MNEHYIDIPHSNKSISVPFKIFDSLQCASELIAAYNIPICLNLMQLKTIMNDIIKFFMKD